MIGYGKTTRATLASGLVIALALATGAPTARAGDNGQCPLFTATKIDNDFLSWAQTNGFDPNSGGTLSCTDQPTLPSIEFEASTPSGVVFAVVVEPDPNSPGTFKALEANGGIAVLSWPNLTVPQRYVCRAEILRSVTWRQYCAGTQQ